MIDGSIQLETRTSTGTTTDIAAHFRAARQTRQAIAGFPGPVPESLKQSYAIQDQAIKDWPDQVAGWKVGRILGDLVSYHGTDRLLGPIFSAGLLQANAEASTTFEAISGGFCAVEAEYVFELADDAEPTNADYDTASALDLVGKLWTGIEIAGSPLATINDLGPTVVVADFGNNWGLILGNPVLNWRERLPNLRCSMEIDDALIGEGDVSAFPGGIEQSLVFALNCAASRGMPLKRGMLISTGAVTGVHEIKSGSHARAGFGTDGDIICHCNPASNPLGN